MTCPHLFLPHPGLGQAVSRLWGVVVRSSAYQGAQSLRCLCAPSSHLTLTFELVAGGVLDPEGSTLR